MKLSIITINFNNRDGLQRTINSVLSQSFKDFELIVIDGGSTDGSRNLLEIYKKYFSYWCSEPDKGVYNAQNKGISVAKGEYMSFMNSGDEFYDKDILKNVFMNEPKADILYGDWVHRYSNSEKIQYAPHEMSLIYIFTDNICHQAMFIRSSLLRQKGYDENMKIFSDWKRWREAVLARNTFQYVPHVICKFDAGGISGTPSQQNAYERQLLYDAIPKEFKSSVNEHAKLKEKLYRYDNNSFMKETYNLVFERPLYCHFIRLNLLFLKYLKKCVDFLSL